MNFALYLDNLPVMTLAAARTKNPYSLEFWVFVIVMAVAVIYIWVKSWSESLKQHDVFTNTMQQLQEAEEKRKRLEEEREREEEKRKRVEEEQKRQEQEAEEKRKRLEEERERGKEKRKRVEEEQKRQEQEAEEKRKRMEEKRKRKEKELALYIVLKKKPFLDEIAASPQEPIPYVQLARFLVRALELEKELEEYWASSETPVLLDHIALARKFNWLSKSLLMIRLRMSWGIEVVLLLERIQEEKGLASQGKPRETWNMLMRKTSSGKWLTLPSEAEPFQADRALLNEASEAYLKAISLGAGLSSYTLGSTKLHYAKLLVLVFGSSRDYYAREAEKDLRTHLRRYPDHIAALEKLADAIFIYQSNDKVRLERLNSIKARIEEARVRQNLKVAPPSGIRPPGEPQSPYPPNWADLSQSIKKRDRFRCTQCGASDVELHVHHVVPLSQGGSNDLDNLVTLCASCHSEIHPRMGDA
ncbi:MAG: HNH endonuclease [Chloroflexi bacterium]|nr:HNH endonuclease [Chloroflexota bacterium]